MKTVTFYHSATCPRCRLAGLSLKQLLPEFPGVSVEKVELLTNLGRSRREGVSRIPTLVAGEQRLSAFYLTKKRIRRFLESLADGAEIEALPPPNDFPQLAPQPCPTGTPASRAIATAFASGVTPGFNR